jgi:formylglycine-generating enzyme required for sulfatase activity
MSETASMRFRAFLSYAHADTRWAKWLHGRLESYRVDADLVGRETSIGPIPTKLSPIFRDRDDFAGGHTLTEATIAALDASTALIVLCSAVSAGRSAVNEEVRLFKSRHPDRTIIPVIIEGKSPENFPPALRFDVAPDGTISDKPVTVLAADMREEGDGKRLALAKVIAGLTGVATDDIFRRAERAERAAKWQRRRTLALVAVLLAFMVAVGLTHGRWYPVLDATAYRIINLGNDMTRPGEVFQDCTGCPEMVVIPAGSFMMGSADAKKDQWPQHKVTIAKPFAVSKFEITYDQWDMCVAAGGCDNKLSYADWGRGTKPVVRVTWDDARQFVLWMSSRTRQSYRLLSEAEWEYAARGIRDASLPHPNFWWGNEMVEGYANCNGCGSKWDHTAPVGSFKPNPFGLYDMLGNVHEWVQDCYKSSYHDVPTDGSPAVELDDCPRILRGGSFVDYYRDIPLARRIFTFQTHSDVNIGFRVARTLLPHAER